MTKESDKPKKGFNGLNSMVSVVDVPESQIKVSVPSTEESTTARRGAPLEFHLSPIAPETPFWKKTWFKWTSGFIILVIIVSTFSDKKEVSANHSVSGNSGATSTYKSSYEEMPPIGDGLTLTSDQIRYCLSEKIRIEGWETNVNTYSDVSVNTFNNAVENFNMRCSRYRYKKYAMESVSSQVEARRAELYAEGLRKAALYSGR